MTTWQFLIQKENDHAWLPLESPSVEVLEGRYQLVAHTDAVGLAVQVDIIHRYEQDGVIQAEQHHQEQVVDAQGQLAILPLAYLRTGLWAITCRPQGETASPMTEPLWQHTIHLQVQAHDHEGIDEVSLAPLSPSLAQAAQVMLADEKLSQDYNLVGVAGHLLDPKIQESEPMPVTAAAALVSLPEASGPIAVPPVSAQPAAETQEHPSPTLPLLPRDLPSLRLKNAAGFIIPPEICPPEQSPQTFDQLQLPIFNQRQRPLLPFESVVDSIPAAAVHRLSAPIAGAEAGGESIALDQKPEVRESDSDCYPVMDACRNLPGNALILEPEMALAGADGSLDPTGVPRLDEGAGNCGSLEYWQDPVDQPPPLKALGPDGDDPWATIDQQFKSLGLQMRFHRTLANLALTAHPPSSAGVVIQMPPAVDSTAAEGNDSEQTFTSAEGLSQGEDSPVPPVDAPQAPSIQLILPDGELIVDAPTPVTIRVSPAWIAAEGYVKVWVRDHHTGDVLVPPQTLLAWSYNSELEVYETATEITVPWGSLAASFVATAVNPLTQEEYSETVEDRFILPTTSLLD